MNPSQSAILAIYNSRCVYTPEDSGMNKCSFIGYPELDNMCFGHHCKKIFTKWNKENCEQIRREMTAAYQYCSHVYDDGTKCNQKTEYISDHSNYCSEHFIDNGEPYISKNDRCEYEYEYLNQCDNDDINMNEDENEDMKKCKRVITIISGPIKMCYDHFMAKMKKDYYEKNREHIESELERMATYNEQWNSNIPVVTTDKTCVWIHPFLYQRCTKPALYDNHLNGAWCCNRHTTIQLISLN